MNPDAEQNQDYGYENRTGQNSRYKMTQRRTWRHRGGNDRGSYNRNPRERKNTPGNRDSQRAPAVPQSIDINDSTQWPSIQEVSAGRTSRGRVSAPINRYSESRVESHDVQDRNEEPDSQRFSRRNSSYIPSNTYQSQPQPATPVYPYQSRQASNYRARGGRYAGPTRGYNVGYGRRYSRGPYQAFVPPVTHDQVYTGIINGHFVLNPVPVNYVDDRPRTAEALRQVEYYFSPQNLENDFYVRSRMDSEGWVDLGLIYQFKRVQRLELSFEDFVNSLLSSEQLELDLDYKRVRTTVDPKKWVYDNPPSKDSQNSDSATRTSPVSELNYMIPGPQMNPMMMPMNPGYPLQSNRGRYYSQSFGMFPAPIYGYQYPEYPTDLYYQCYPQAFYAQYGQEGYPQGQNVSGTAGDNSAPEEIGDSGVASQINQDDTQAVGSSLTEESAVPILKSENMDDLAEKVSNMGIGNIVTSS